MRNVSSTGAFIHCTKPLNPKETCSLKIEMPGGRTQEIDAEGDGGEVFVVRGDV